MNTDLDILQYAISSLTGMDGTAFNLSRKHWQLKSFQKGEFYNEYKNVCKHLGFIIDGVFRTYYIDGKSGEEKNMFFFSKHQVVVAYRSFVTQTPCNYYTQSMTESTIYYIHINHLQELYATSHEWEKFGRLLAEIAANKAMERIETFLFQTAEERYLDLMKEHPDVFNAIPLYHISSYLGIQGPSLSRIRKRLATS